MILDTIVDIYKKTESEGGVGSGSDYDWDTARETGVEAKVTTRPNLPKARERVASQDELEYDWLCFLPRYDEGSERTVEESDKIGYNSLKYTINAKFTNPTRIILAIKAPEEA